MLSKVMSVRLSLENLQSCFDLCELTSNKARGGSSAIAKALSLLLEDLRGKGILPVYREEDLEALLSEYIPAKNPTSMPSLEKLSQAAMAQSSQSPLTSRDFAPVCSLPSDPASRVLDEIEPDLELLETEAQSLFEDEQEYNLLLEEKIREQMKLDEEDLLAKILIGG